MSGQVTEVKLATASGAVACFVEANPCDFASHWRRLDLAPASASTHRVRYFVRHFVLTPFSMRDIFGIL